MSGPASTYEWDKPMMWANPYPEPRTLSDGPLPIAGLDLGPAAALYNGMDKPRDVTVGHYGAITCHVRPKERAEASRQRWGGFRTGGN